MSKLKLVTTETFGDLACNFYRNMNDDILLTREQIGQALEYANPIKAIQKIHLKHAERLEPLCLRIKGGTQIGGDLTKSEEQEKVYTQREALWKFVVGHDKQKQMNLWIGYGILLKNIDIMN